MLNDRHGRIQRKKECCCYGAKTWDSVPEEFRPLSDRSNVVLTKNKDIQFPDGVIVAHSLKIFSDNWTRKSNVGGSLCYWWATNI